MSDNSEDEETLRKELKQLEQKLKDKTASKKRSAGNLSNPPSTPPHKKVSVEVTASPTGTSNKSSPKSPQRVLLGLEKKIQAKDVNLRRSPQKSKNASSSSSNVTSFMSKMKDHKQKAEQQAKQKQEFAQARVKGFNKTTTLNQEEIDLASGIEHEKYTKFRLSKRHVRKEVLDKELEDKNVLTLKQLQTIVCPPDFNYPNYPNFVIIAICCSKSDVKFMKTGMKFMNMTLTDFTSDITLTLRGDALEKYFKIGDGSVVAILNPGFYVKTDEAGGKTFGMVLEVAGDNGFISIGVAHDFGYCKAMTAKGSPCTSWVHSKHSDYCQYHTGLGINRARNKRQELNSATTKTFTPHAAASATKYDPKKNYYHKQKKGKDKEQQEVGAGTRVDGLEGNLGKVYATSQSLGLDEAEQPSQQELDRRKKKRAKQIEKEKSIREKLSKRPEAYLMREYDAKGNIILTDQDLQRQRELESAPKLFSAEQIRKLGFDPTKKALDKAYAEKENAKAQAEERAKFLKSLRGDASKVLLARDRKNVKNKEKDDSDSDDLEIV